MTNDSNLIKRVIVLDILCALLAIVRNFAQLTEQTPYAAGYQTGFEDAILTIARAVGLKIEMDKEIMLISNNTKEI